jgi:hypothetical protein
MNSITELARQLETLTDAAAQAAAQIGEADWRTPYAPGKWTRLEVIGHLLDSGAHNHQRFARALHEDAIAMPGYDGGEQVRVLRYAEMPVGVAIEAWRTQNRVIAFVIGRIPADREGVACTIGAYPAMTLRDLALDYVAHMEHHLRQVFGGRELPYSGMPWPPEGRWE